jgi:GDP-L-fucose synthase
VECWGSGSAKREFLHVDDLSTALIFLMDNYNSEGWVNVGTGVDLSIKELAETIAEIAGYKGEIVWDSSKPDGAPRKLLNVDKMSGLGWSSKITLTDGLKSVYDDYAKSRADG